MSDAKNSSSLETWKLPEDPFETYYFIEDLIEDLKRENSFYESLDIIKNSFMKSIHKDEYIGIFYNTDVTDYDELIEKCQEVLEANPNQRILALLNNKIKKLSTALRIVNELLDSKKIISDEIRFHFLKSYFPSEASFFFKLLEGSFIEKIWKLKRIFKKFKISPNENLNERPSKLLKN